MKRKQCKTCGANNWGVSRQLKRGYITRYCKPCSVINSRIQHQRARIACIEAYGSVCVICGFTDVRALQIDHVNGGGRKERMSMRRSPYYRKVLKDVGNGTYQLLCANCNVIKEADTYGQR